MLKIIQKLLKTGSSNKLGFATVVVILLAIVVLTYLKKENSGNANTYSITTPQASAKGLVIIQNNQNGDNNYVSKPVAQQGIVK